MKHSINHLGRRKTRQFFEAKLNYTNFLLTEEPLTLTKWIATLGHAVQHRA
jgi:hypothetical protein